MMVTRAQMRAARHPECVWSEADMSQAIAARFPGTGSVDLADLIAAWLADATLPHGTLAQCAQLACTLTSTRTAGVWLHPKEKLREVAATL